MGRWQRLTLMEGSWAPASLQLMTPLSQITATPPHMNGEGLPRRLCAVEAAEPVLAADLGEVGRFGDHLLQRGKDLSVAAGIARRAAAAAGHVEADADMVG